MSSGSKPEDVNDLISKILAGSGTGAASSSGIGNNFGLPANYNDYLAAASEYQQNPTPDNYEKFLIELNKFQGGDGTLTPYYQNILDQYRNSYENGVGNSWTPTPSLPGIDPVNSLPGTSTESSNSGSSLGIGAIIGLVMGAIVVVVIVAAFIIWLKQLNKSKAKDLDSQQHSTEAGITGRTAAPTEIYSNQTKDSGNHYHSVKNSDTFPSTASSMKQSVVIWDDPTILAARIPLEKIHMIELIARGGYGEVHRGLYGSQPVAIKKLLPDSRKDMKQINGFLEEIKLMASLEHERIVPFVGVAWNALTDLCAVTVLMEHGDLRSLLQKYDQNRYPQGFTREKVNFALHTTHALTYLHSLNPVVMHRDLKSKNILLTSGLNGQLEAKLTDFGVARESSLRTMTAGVGTSLWMAPEVMMGERYDVKADVFSLGVVLSELDTHQLPYYHAKEGNLESGRSLPDTAILQMVVMGRLSVHFTGSSDNEMVKIGKACISLDPNDRPSASEVLWKLQVVLRNM